MPVRSFSARGFGVTIAIPDRLGRMIRRVLRKHPEPNPRLLVYPPPSVAPVSRLEEVAEVRRFAAATATADAHGEEATVSSHSWYHTIDLLDGTTTPGRYDHRALVPHYGLPRDLQGKRALDVGSGDGFWAFELERRGADVSSVDIESFADVDLPTELLAVFRDQPLRLPFRRGLEIARRQRGSTIKLLNTSIYELDPDAIGTFDFVHAGDILLHLRDPALALQRLHAVTSGEALFADVFDPTLDELGAGPDLTRYRGGWTDVQWWRPSLSALAQMVADAGFHDVKVLTTYSIEDLVAHVQGPWHAVIHAYS